VHERARNELPARRGREEQQVARGDRAEAGHDTALGAAQHERDEGAEREGDRVRAEQAAREEGAAVLGEDDERQGDREVRVRDSCAEGRGDEGAAGRRHEPSGR
jgi:hypothetical protein